MKRALFTLFCAVTLPVLLPAQTAPDPNEGACLFQDSLNTYTFKWWGRAGHTYFIQTSPDLFTWVFLDEIESGENLIIPYVFTSTADKFFVRVKFTDQPTDDRFNSDFDGDGVSNAAELALGTDPFLKTDTDGDGLFDDWEIAHGFNPTLQDSNQNGVPDGNEDADGDTLNNLDEQSVGGDPAVNQWTTEPPQIEYNDAGQLTLFTAPGGATTSFAQDSEGNVKTTP